MERDLVQDDDCRAGTGCRVRLLRYRKEPDGWQPPQVHKEGDFQRVRNAVVVETPLGYQVRGQEPGKDGVALKKLDKPLTDKVILRTKVRIVSSGQLINAFLAFGDGPVDEQLVKCGFRVRNKTAMIGYAINRAHWGKGIAPEAARAVITWAFETFGLARLWASTDAQHTRSRRVLEKLGMRHEGTLSSNHTGRSGERVDEVVYGLLREEWVSLSLRGAK